MEARDNKGQKVKDTIKILANAIASGKSDLSILDKELFLELVQAAYGTDDSEDRFSYDELEKMYVNMYEAIMQREDSTLMKMLLYILASDLHYNQLKDEYWVGIVKETLNLIPKKKDYDVRELFLQQNNGQEGFFERWDTVVRYLAIEDYFGKNNYGFELYRKMQGLRGGADYIEIAEQKFRKLITSFEEKGYNNDSEIVCDKNLKLLDGSHRLALALYFGIPRLSVNIKDETHQVEYSEKWFVDAGFTEDERNLIRKKANELIKRCKVPFECIIWSPAQNYFDDITNELGKMYPLISYQDYEYKEETFSRLVKGVYHIDDIEDWKVQKKIEYMQPTANKVVRVVKLDVDSPQFRLKAKTSGTLSQVGEYIKSYIRGKYKDKLDNYFYDIIIHIGDNFEQNEYVDKLFREAFSLRGYLSGLSQYKYYLTKTETPYQTEDFPDTYAFSKDLDIICAKEDFEKIAMYTQNYLDENVKQYEVIVKQQKDNIRFRIELKGFLIYQFDISCAIEGLDALFVADSLSRRELKDGYYVSTLEDEIVIRKNEYYKHPEKMHHAEFLKKYHESLEVSRGDNLRKRLEYNKKFPMVLNPVQLKAKKEFMEQEKNKNIIYEKYNCECGATAEDFEVLSEEDRYGLPVHTVICKKCGLVMTNPRMIQESYDYFYQNIFGRLYRGVDKGEDYEQYFERQKKRGELIYHSVKEMWNAEFQNILEIGCASGGILGAFAEHGYQVTGIDLDDKFLEYGRNRGLNLLQGHSSELVSQNQKYDLIILSHVLEHFLDLEQELSVIASLLNQNGKLYIQVPGIKMIEQGHYDYNFQLYLQNAHVRHFSLGTLEDVLENYGFELIIGNEMVEAMFAYTGKKKKGKNYYEEIVKSLLIAQKKWEEKMLKENGV